MNLMAWLQIAVAALTTANPAIGTLVGMVTSGVMTIQGDSEEDKALIAQWQSFCQKIVDENRDPTQEEHDAARAFADSVHAQNQSA